MKRFLLILASVAALLVCACDKYDDSSLKNQINGLEQRVQNLEDLCSKLNTNIASIQTLLQNIDAKIAIERVVTLDNDEGYLITFTNGASITVYNGLDGAKGNKGDKGEQGEKGDQGDPGATPVIGVAQEDGVFYWTINGEWLTDAEGNKIPVIGEKGEKGDPGDPGTDGSNGSNGADGITPQLKIEGGKWMASYDNGVTWSEVEKSEGDAYNTMALTIEETEDAYIITLNGESYTISKAAAAASFQIKVDNDDVTLSGQSVTLTYTLTGADETTHVVAEGTIQAEVDEDACTVTINAGNVTEGYVILRAIRNSDGAYSAQYIAVAGSILEIVEGEEITVDGNGGNFEVKVRTNLEYDVTLPDWITEDPDTKAIRIDTKSFTAKANTTGAERTATLTFKASDGSIEKAVVITQPEGSKEGDGTLENPYNVAEAIELVADLTWTSKDDYEKVGPYYIKGIISSIDEEYGERFGNATFFIKDADSDNSFEAYRILYLENQKWVEGNTQIKVGDEVVIYGEIMNYKGDTPETVSGSAYLYSLNGNTTDAGDGDVTAKVSFSKSAVSMEVGEEVANPAETNSTATVTYTSDDESVATVSADGTITAIAAGTATITAAVEAVEGFTAGSATCKVTVKESGSSSDDTSYTLDSEAIKAAHTAAWSYTSGEQTIIATDGSEWIAYNTYASTNQVTVQMNKGKGAYLLTPEAPDGKYVKSVTVVTNKRNDGTGDPGDRPLDIQSADGSETLVSNTSAYADGLDITGQHSQVRIICNEENGGATYIVSVTVEFE